MTIGAVGQKVLKYGIKAAGAAGIGICLYDAHKHGKYKSQLNANKAKTEAGLYWLDNAMYTHSPSSFVQKAKWRIYDLESRNTVRRAFNAVTGYIKGAVGMMTEDIVPLGLSVAALLTKGKIAPKIAGGALGLYALYGTAKNVLGFGIDQNFGNDSRI